MNEIAQGLNDFAKAQDVITWLKDNQLLKNSDVCVGELAFSFAMSAANPHVIEAFVQSARIALERQERIATLPKRSRIVSNLKVIDALDAQRIEQQSRRKEAILLASKLVG
ncbi:MAG: hypothetical protein Q7S87_03260 [Agitococcus sp.]|nr:hypothetical protein [Agitococcus sp.]MDO9178654.1 hypothetical protein [Agitococcus sp.]